MKITVIGTGYVGLVAGTCLADFGNDVVCVDIDKKKIDELNKGNVPFYEPGLKDILERTIKQKRITFTTESDYAIQMSEVIFIAVGTPEGKGHKADLSAVFSIAKQIGKNLNGYKVIVNKSTVPVGTAEKVKRIIEDNKKHEYSFDIVSNPEFLREGAAINDFTLPDRIVIGVESEKAKKVMESIYKAIARVNKPIVYCDIKSAELIKYASNAMLATRISFMNEISCLCEKVGANVKTVAKGIGLDSRIGPRFLQAGLGYGGSCFPKDVKALIETLKEHGCEANIVEAVEKVNERQKKILIPRIKKALGNLKGKTIAIWGLAFKPKTDDMRDAPSIAIINELQKLGAKIKAFDPEAQKTAKMILKDIVYCNDPYDAVKDVNALVIVTEWNEFRELDMVKVKGLMKEPYIFDGRNIYEPEEMKNFNYFSIGR